MAEFDAHSKQYVETLDDVVELAGEDAQYFARYKAQWLVRLNAQPQKILDFGCGIGLLTQHLLEHFQDAEITAFDVSRESLDKIPKQVAKNVLIEEHLDKLQGEYDIIVIANVLHHILPSERLGTFAKLAPLLADGGRIVCFEHNPLNPLTRWVVANCAFDEDAILLWPGELRQLADTLRWNVETLEYIVFFPHQLRMLRPLERYLSHVPLGAQYVVSLTR